MFSNSIKVVPASGASKYDSRGLELIILTLMNIDVWMLKNVGYVTKKSFKLIKPIIESFFIMSIGAGLLIAYSIVYTPNLNDFFSKKPQNFPREELMAISDASESYKALIHDELTHLKSKAFSLEMTIKRMHLELKNLNKYHKNLGDLMPDFASEAAGGTIISIPDTESFYQPHAAEFSIFGIPIWKPNYFTPRKVIQPWTQPGECWAFRGSHGNVEIELARTALVSSVTLEHIPITASLTGTINSAPKEFRVLGKFRDKYLILGSFQYNYNGPSSQIFQITKSDRTKIPLNLIMLQILSNWGNPEYTCIYRLRVHGKLYDSTDDSVLLPKKKLIYNN
ncbi:GSCOCG00013244001-RA-CDS [Cotesia congregata]|uniref:Similar to SUN1: SUN domain-containing protein 1 (Homo sapiens) n=1 Tax=Cotesia congregata TaxID=51543 RepID=A0A8J2MMG6_COTCN|nr:GSCOCG00013244001-RA-CDS [Cotesia congregata]CAG5094068.1 Similar to SUN1: SUN domain-containing protein 1 (Homo sapiens) [Cotesia congregata]